MSGFLLTQSERDRFAAYLEHDAATTDGIVRQMELIGMPEALMRQFKTEADAARLVARKLRSIQAEALP